MNSPQENLTLGMVMSYIFSILVVSNIGYLIYGLISG